MDRVAHWDRVYAATPSDQVSWYAPHLATSLEWVIEAAAPVPRPVVSVIDVGGGASTLVDDLYLQGFRALTVLDVSCDALWQSQERMGSAAREIWWVAADITQVELPEVAFDVWHDRAVFHFLTEQADKAAYRERVAKALKPRGQVVLATFSMNGPQSCSGLPVCRYDAESMAREFAPEFRVVETEMIEHRTPDGGGQEFLYTRFARLG
ncbi:class I SAM-dependent methyltransferase [Acidicapsa dinghuensis]|uniref:Class I SAM-dependent methyltransferase n=1 Tax=Acidicapsa dinghuensis TaxID=2218256 RepID=A0ABW1EAM7_9BACT|nr:class I SAM-dependent methyltransferase [Acidicapsa dinghuensis]